MKKLAIALIGAVLVFGSGILLAKRRQREIPTSAFLIARELIQSPRKDARDYSDMVSATVEKFKDLPEAERTKKFEEASKGAGELDALRSDYSLALYDRALSRQGAAVNFGYYQLRAYYESAENAKSAMQANQLSGEASLNLQAFQIAQNARIIELLEKLNAKSK